MPVDADRRMEHPSATPVRRETTGGYVRFRLITSVVLMLVLSSAGSAFADFGYTVRLNQDGFFGEVDFSEESLLTTFATITDFDKNTLTAPDGNLAEYLVMSPVAGGPDCVLPFLSGSAACFGIHFAGGALASNALFGMLPDLNAPGTYGTPGSFFLTIHAAPEPPSWLLLLIGGVLLVCSRSGHGTRRQRLRHPA